MPRLKYIGADEKDVVIDLDNREVTVGRLSRCDVVIRKPTVSRTHARIFARNGTWFICDLGSSHGTLVNHERIKECRLSAGDFIQIGTETVQFLGDVWGDDTVAMTIPESSRELLQDSPSLTAPEIAAAHHKEHEIVAEQALGAGDLAATFARARSLDVTQIIRNPSGVIAEFENETATPIAHSLPSLNSDQDAESSIVTSHLLTLVRISEELRRCTDVDSVCKTAVEMVMQATQADRGVLALRDDAGTFTPQVECTSSGGAGQIVRISRTFVDRMVSKKVALLALDTGQDQALSAARSVVALDIRSILCAPLWDGEEILGYLYLDSTGIGRQFGHNDLDFASAVGHQAASEITRLRLMQRIRSEEERRRNLARFLSPEVIIHVEQEAAAGRLDPTLSAAQQVVTILFTDIKGFTSLSERMDPSEIKRFLDDYFDRMTEIIVDRHRGTLDKYIGDAIMALFGAPYSAGTQDDAVRCVAAAIEMRDTLSRLQNARPDYRRIQVRMGINTGTVVAGMIGSQRRLEYSVIGDPVNVASRLESTAKADGIQIGESTYQLVRHVVDCEFTGELKVKNRAMPVRTYLVKNLL